VLLVETDRAFSIYFRNVYIRFTFTIINNRRTTPAYFGARAIMASDRSVERRIPRDAAVVINVLRSMGVEEWEPRVVNQLMEFVHRTSTPP
jgi:hypothetical protein